MDMQVLGKRKKALLLAKRMIIMGVAERKAREKEELKALILQAAKKLFIEKGVDQTTIRGIAKEIQYSVGTVYVYYKDKNEILHDLHQQGFAQLGGDMRVLLTVSEPMERIKALGRTYINFALKNTEMYDLMFNLKAPMEYIHNKDQEQWNEGTTTFGVLRETVRQCMEAGYFAGHDLEPLSFSIWSCVHGMCSLYIRDRIKGATHQDPEWLLHAAFEDYIKLIEKK